MSRNLNVRVSIGLTCGCSLRPSGPIPHDEAAQTGRVVICDRCQEYAVVNRVTHRLILNSAELAALLEAGADLDDITARAIAAEQRFAAPTT